VLYIFNREEELTLILSNDNEATPYYNAEIHDVLGGEFTFTFSVAGNSEEVRSIQEYYYVAVKIDGNYQLFTITEIDESHDQILERTFYCEHSIIELNDFIIEDEFIDRKQADQALEAILTGVRWEAGQIAPTAQHTYTIRNTSVLEALQTFVNRWGGELFYYVEFNGREITRRIIDHVDRLGEDRGRRLEYSKDITKIERTKDVKDVKTELLAFGVVRGEDEDGNELEEEISVTVENEEARLKFGIYQDGEYVHRTGVYDAREVSGNIELREKAEIQLENASVPAVTYSIDYVDLHELTGLSHEEIRKGDTVTVIDRDLDIQIKARVIERKIDPVFPELFNSYVLGNFRPVFSERFQDIEQRFRESRQEWESKLDRGDTIRTRWLEDEINLLNKRLISGGGTVTLTENDGIIITDKPLDENPTQAIRLVGGMLAIADSKKAGSDEFDFRTFGTGSGFTADEINSGLLRFDRSRGGTLTLGGERIGTTDSGKALYEHGILNIVDETGQIIATLDGSQGGFNRLHIGDLTASNVNNKTLENFHVFVNHAHGNDDNDGLTADKPVRSINEALSRIPKQIDHDVRIIVQNMQHAIPIQVRHHYITNYQIRQVLLC
jgi:phage minor structural protein